MMFEPAPRHALANRFFFAVRPPARLGNQIANASSWFGSEGRAIDPARLHVTMAVLDDFEIVPYALPQTLLAAGDRIAGPPVEIAFDQAVGTNRSVALRARHRNAPLETLARSIDGALLREGLAQRTGYRFSPHMTLFYRAGRPAVQRIAPVSWRADEVVLIHSHVGRTRHDLLGRWSLKETAPVQFDLF